MAKQLGDAGEMAYEHRSVSATLFLAAVLHVHAPGSRGPQDTKYKVRLIQFHIMCEPNVHNPHASHIKLLEVPRES